MTEYKIILCRKHYQSLSRIYMYPNEKNSILQRNKFPKLLNVILNIIIGGYNNNNLINQNGKPVSSFIVI